MTNMLRCSLAVALLMLASSGCGPSGERVEAPVAPPVEPTAEPETPPPPPLGPASERGWTEGTLDCAKRTGAWNEPRSNGVSRADAMLFGISAPREPLTVRSRSHVRRRAVDEVPGETVSRSFSRAVDGATFDTRACGERDGRAADFVIVVSAEKGAVKKVRALASDLDDLSQCVVDAVCNMTVPNMAGEQRAAFGVRVRPIATDRAKVEVRSSGDRNDARVVASVVADVATGCEQGQMATADARWIEVAATATPHSTVRPTLNVAFPATSTPPPDDTFTQCLASRLEGYRLPLEPWHPVDRMVLRVTWTN
jgi:hypothetical protein